MYLVHHDITAIALVKCNNTRRTLLQNCSSITDSKHIEINTYLWLNFRYSNGFASQPVCFGYPFVNDEQFRKVDEIWKIDRSKQTVEFWQFLTPRLVRKWIRIIRRKHKKFDGECKSAEVFSNYLLLITIWKYSNQTQRIE